MENANNTSLTFLKQGKECAESGDIINAIAYFTKAIEEDTDNIDAYIERGKTLMSIGDKDNATKDMMEILKRKPELAEGIIKSL